MTKFATGSKEHGLMLELKKAFNDLVPPAEQANTQPAAPAQAPATQPRAQGSPDYSLGGGKEPLDLTRLVDLCGVPDDEFTEERPGSTHEFCSC